MAATKTKDVDGSKDFLGTGRRKTSVARVRVRPGAGRLLINKRPFDEYFYNEKDREQVLAPLVATDMRDTVDIVVRVHGGGFTGQSGAVKLGIARALIKYVPDMEEKLRDNGLLTRDARMKERKKYGLHGARKGTQFSKR